MRITPDKEDGRRGDRIALPCTAETESFGIIYTGEGTHIHQTQGKGIARMETTYLEEFIHLSKTASFTKTSLALNISQPTLSRHIALLESEFGYPLIDRTTHTFKITRAGLELLNSSYEIVSLIERARKEAHRLANAPRDIVFGGYYYLERIQRYLLESIMKAKRENLPFTARIYEAHTTSALLALREINMVDDLRKGSIDVLLVPLPSNSPLLDEFNGRVLFREKVAALISEDSPIATEGELSLEDLEGLHFLHGGSLLLVNFCIDDMIARAGIDPRFRVRIANTEADYYFLAPDEVTFLTESSAESRKGRYPSVTTRRIDDPEAYFTIYALYRRDDQASFIEEALDMLK